MKFAPKIVSIGSGSASFYLSTLSDIFKQKSLDNATICMVDTNEHMLKKVSALGMKLKKEMKSNIRIISNVNREEEVLQDADFVILTIAVDREKTWKEDIKIAEDYEIWHYGENGGPGAFGHAARNIATLIPILNDIQDYAPHSTIINFTNPLSRIHYAISSSTNLNCISYCHQYFHGYYILGRILLKDLIKQGHKFPNYEYSTIREASLSEYDVLASGINHFTWMLEIKRKTTLENIYPLLRNHIKEVPEDFEKLTRKMFQIFNYLPVPGETHLSEYLPYTKTKNNWKKYNLYHFDFEAAKMDKKRNIELIDNILAGKKPISCLNYDQSERIAVIIAELSSDTNTYEPTINIENKGSITNLPYNGVIEVPCTLSRKGVVPIKIGKMPEPIASICQREIIISRLIVEGSIKGDREMITQAFAIDPMVNDLDLAEQLVNDYILNFKEYLPQFYDHWDVR